MCDDTAPTLNAHFGEKQGLENQHINGGGDCLSPPVAMCLSTNVRMDAESETLLAINGGGFDVAPVSYRTAGDGAAYEEGDVTAPLTTGTDRSASIVAFCPLQITSKANRSAPKGDVMHTMPASSTPPHLASIWQVRRLTPIECERLMGFPEGFTAIPYGKKPAALCPDGPRYKALGNSWAVNCAEWIGERIAEVDQWGGYAQERRPTGQK
jgi:DNA (cytosine-5)-methyltransferase 1